MLIAVVSTFFLCGPYLVWQFLIRPYCLRNGKGFTAGTNWAATMWVDWQEAKELAVARGDKQIIKACHAFLWIHLAILLAGVLALLVGIVGF